MNNRLRKVKIDKEKDVRRAQRRQQRKGKEKENGGQGTWISL